MFFNFHIDLIYNAQWSAYTKARQTLDVNFVSTTKFYYDHNELWSNVNEYKSRKIGLFSLPELVFQLQLFASRRSVAFNLITYRGQMTCI